MANARPVREVVVKAAGGTDNHATSGLRVGRRTRRRAWSAAAAVLVGAATTLTVGGTSQAATRPAVVRQRTDAAGVTWLCRPGLVGDPCAGDLSTTVIGPYGTRRIVHRQAAANPPIDCFYVYPTVSSERTGNADLVVQPAETDVAVAQAAQFSTQCRVYAPMYRQATLSALLGTSTTPVDRAEAYDDVLAAWHDYLAHYNDGRGVVLIGHSQGALVLTELISAVVDGDASVRSRLVSAILLGGNVTVPDGEDVGGDFRHIPACRSADQTGCVIAYSTFAADSPPPADSLFGRTTAPGMQVLCTNPAALGGGNGTLDVEVPTRVGGLAAIFGADLASALPRVSTPWVTETGQVNGQCRSTGGATWLSVSALTLRAQAVLTQVAHVLPATWGTHLVDVNVALGNLVQVVGQQARQWANHHR